VNARAPALRFPLLHRGLQLPQHVLEPPQLLPVTRPIPHALRFHRPAERLVRAAREIGGAGRYRRGGTPRLGHPHGRARRRAGDALLGARPRSTGRRVVALAHARDPARDDATLRAIEGESDRLGVIVGDLLTLARADAGERPVAREPLYLDDIAADALEAARALAQRKGVVLEVGSFEEARITGDPALVRRLLIIVLDNAIKYTPKDGRVRLDVTAADGLRTVVVTDTGIGIPADQLPRIFERFYRGDQARHAAEGAGLGLAIAKWISELHGARLAFSALPQGTRVAIEFPAGV